MASVMLKIMLIIVKMGVVMSTHIILHTRTHMRMLSACSVAIERAHAVMPAFFIVYAHACVSLSCT